MKQLLLFCLLGMACQSNAGWLIISDGDLTVGGTVTVKGNNFNANTKDINSNASVVITYIPTEEHDSFYIISKGNITIIGKLNAAGNITIFTPKNYEDTKEASIKGKNVTIGKITSGEIESLVIPAIQEKFGKASFIRGDFDGGFLLDLFKKN